MSFKDAKRGDTLCVVQVRRTERVTPNMMRVTLGGEQLSRLPDHGFDHWFRLFLPHEDGAADFGLPEKVDLLGYLKYLRMPSATRPHMRNYTVREFRPHALELDVDFVVHGDEGVATRWVQRARPGDTVALIDQGRGYDADAETDFHLLVGDETALPAIAGILRDLPREARGLAIVELSDGADEQPVDAPEGFEVRWLVRAPRDRPGSVALQDVQSVTRLEGTVGAYLVGESALATGARRHLVGLGVPKQRIHFTGYWKLGKGS